MKVFHLGEAVIDLVAATVTRSNVTVDLTPLEAGLLRYLAEHAGEVVPYDELLREVWGYRPGVVSRTISNVVSRIRNKIEDEPAHPRFLCSVYGRGLRLDGLENPSENSTSDNFFGRERALVFISEQFRGGRRLVTLTGPAGIGKTRTAKEWLPRSAWRPLEVQCGSVRTPEELDAAVLAALGGAQQATVGSLLRGSGSVLLVLDECERAQEAISQRVARWLADVPSLRVLATSRFALGAFGEQLVWLEPLDEGDATRLFIDRAKQIDPMTELPEDRVLRVIERIDRLPLALELAAGRVHLLGLEGLVKRLERPLEVLSSQRVSMEELLERSWDLLSREDRVALTIASVFEAPFELDALAFVMETSSSATLARVESLVTRSLLQIERGAPVRYAPYRVVRDRARRALGDLNIIEITTRHARWFAALPEPTHPSEAPDKWRRLRHASADLRAAFEAMSPREAALAGRCGALLLEVLVHDGALDDALALGGALEDVSCTDADRSIILCNTAKSLAFRGDLKGALPLLETARRLASDPAVRVISCCLLAQFRSQVGDRSGATDALEAARPDLPQARQEYARWLLLRGHLLTGEEAIDNVEQAIAAARRLGDPLLEAMSLSLLSVIRCGRRLDWDGARRMYTLVLSICEGAAGLERALSTALLNQASLDYVRGDLDTAEAEIERAIDLEHQLGQETQVEIASLLLAQIWACRGLFEEATALAEQIIARAWARPHYATTLALRVLAEIQERRGDETASRRTLQDAIEQARLGQWPQLEADLLIALAGIDGDETLLERARQLDHHALAPIAHLALTARIAANKGERDRAEAAYAEVAAKVRTLDLRPESPVSRWLALAESALGRRAVRV